MEKTFVVVLLSALLAGCLMGPTSESPPDRPNFVETREKSIPREVATTPVELVGSPGKTFWKSQVDAAFEPVDCPTPPERNFSATVYSGPLFDAHIHFRSIPDGGSGSELSGENLGTGYQIGQWVCMLEYEGTSKALTFFPVWDPIARESLDVVKRTIDQYPDRFIPFIMPPDDDGSPEGFPTVDAEKLKEMLNVYPGLFQGYGELGLYERPGGAPAHPPDSPRLQDIYPIIRQNKLVVYLHPGENQSEAFERVLTANPDITFIFHGDQWIDCASCDGTAAIVARILENHPNAYYGVDELYGDEFLMRPEVSKKEFIAHFSDYAPLLEKDLANWKAFIERHPDQVLWDTDRGVGAPWSLDLDVALTLNDYSRAFIGRLDPDVQEKFAYKNAEKIFENR